MDEATGSSPVRSTVCIIHKKLISSWQSKKIFQTTNKNILAIEKPVGISSEEIQKKYNYKLIHRIDRDTSGLLLLAKSEQFLQKVIAEFQKKKVYKEYIAIVSGAITKNITIDKKIRTIKGMSAKSFIDPSGKEALTTVYPCKVKDGKSKVKIIIPTGRTHQIRVHLQSIGHAIVGDSKYGGEPAERLMLHAKTIEFLNYKFNSQEPECFSRF